MGLKLLTQQREGTAGLDDEDARSVHGRHLLQQIDQHGRLARAGGTEDQHVRVLLPIGPVQRIEHKRFGAPVEEHQTRVAGTFGSAVQG